MGSNNREKSSGIHRSLSMRENLTSEVPLLSEERAKICTSDSDEGSEEEITESKETDQ